MQSYIVLSYPVYGFMLCSGGVYVAAGGQRRVTSDN